MRWWSGGFDTRCGRRGDVLNNCNKSRLSGKQKVRLSVFLSVGRIIQSVNRCIQKWKVTGDVPDAGGRGHLWQGRFASSPMDENYLHAAVRYVERNPVAGGIVSSPGEYPWSSAKHYLGLRNDPLIQKSPLGDLVPDWTTFLTGEVEAGNRVAIGRAERSGRPLGTADFIERIEGALGRRLLRGKPGSKPKGN